MTTFNMRGSYVDYRGDRTIAAGATELAVVASGSNATLKYTITRRDSDNVAFIDPFSVVQEVRLQGQNTMKLEDTRNVDYQIASVDWAQGTSVLFLISVEMGLNLTRDHIFTLSGPALPRMRNAAQWEAFEAGITDLSDPAGALGPNRAIRWDGFVDVDVTQDDDFFGTAGNDRLKGGAGEDYFVSSAGNDTYNGGAEYDQVSFDHDPGGVIANLASGQAQSGFGGTHRMISIETLRGSAFDDQLLGNGIENSFRGLEGNDTINGRAGDDTVRYDRDANYGGTRGVTVNLSQKMAIDGFGDKDRLISIENVRGSERGDRLTGSNGANELDGLGGNDRLFGLGGADQLYGANGRDTLDGGAGNDRLSGGRAADVFVFSGDFGRDKITDWDAKDRIDLSAVDSITSFADLRSNHLRQKGDSVIINAGDGDKITLLDVSRSDLSAEDFMF